jgi:hypothetical protein
MIGSWRCFMAYVPLLFLAGDTGIRDFPLDSSDIE